MKRMTLLLVLLLQACLVPNPDSWGLVRCAEDYPATAPANTPEREAEIAEFLLEEIERRGFSVREVDHPGGTPDEDGRADGRCGADSFPAKCEITLFAGWDDTRSGVGVLAHELTHCLSPCYGDRVQRETPAYRAQAQARIAVVPSRRESILESVADTFARTVSDDPEDVARVRDGDCPR